MPTRLAPRRPLKSRSSLCGEEPPGGKVPSISKCSGEVKVTGQKQTKLYFWSAGGAALCGQYEWEPD
eukprot:7868346-Heterocapsa_arctica.AAC.1